MRARRKRSVAGKEPRWRRRTAPPTAGPRPPTLKGFSRTVGRTLRILGENRRRRLEHRVEAPRAGQPPVRNRRRSVEPVEKAPTRPSVEVVVRALLRRFRGVVARLQQSAHRVKPFLATSGKALAVAVFAVVAVATGRLVERHVRSSPAFALNEVTLAGNERLARADLLEVAGLRVGDNVFEVPPEEVRARLEGHPWVVQAVVRRRLPNAFDITVREHVAVAVLAMAGGDDAGGATFLVGEEGTVFKRVSPNDVIDLPVVSGVDAARFTDDESWRTSVLLGVVALFHDYRGAGLWRRAPIGEVHVEADDGLSLYVGDDPIYVRLGRGPHREKLRRLRRILDRLSAEETPAYVYLDNVRRPDRVTVRLRPLPDPIGLPGSSDAASGDPS